MTHAPLPQLRNEHLTKEQKAAFILLLFIGILGVVFGFQSFGSNIRRPFLEQTAALADVDPYVPSVEKEAQERLAMKQRDTDEDGLSDYDETFVFKTSAFIADTDSDGLTDRQEIEAGQDPNCPLGKDCFASTAEIVPDIEKELPASSFPETFLPDDVLSLMQADETAQISTEDYLNYLSGLSPAEIRDSLENAGFPPEVLADLNDEELRELFNQAIQDAVASGDLNALLEP